MRVQCDVCEKAEAALVCCADEAALCAACDSQVHAANKLAGKHQRLPLIRPAPLESPCCDICQERTGWFFCLEDRALLCRSCDVTIHSSNSLASSHKRYLVTGLRVALNALSPQDFLDGANSNTTTTTTNTATTTTQTSQAPPFTSSPAAAGGGGAFVGGGGGGGYVLGALETPNSEHASTNGTPVRFGSGTSLSKPEPQAVGEKKSTSSSSSISEYLTEAVPGWRVDELLNIPDLAAGYSLSDVGCSKADATNLGEFDWLADLSLFEEQCYSDTFHEVPQLGSSPAAGASKPKPPPSKGKSKMSKAIVPEADDSLLVPDMFLPSAKRRRTFLAA